MEAIRQTVIVPESHDVDLTLHIPDSIPAGEAEIIVVIQPKEFFSTKEKMQVEKNGERDNPKVESSTVFGMWENRDITLENIRDKAWKRS